MADCDKIEPPQCTVEASILGYLPNIGVNAFFAVALAIIGIVSMSLSVRWKTWSFGIVVFLGCLLETIGYIGRILTHQNPFGGGFQIQIILIIVAPSFLSAGLYLTLKHVVLGIDPRLSRIKPKLYTWLFISADITSILLQFGGGGLEAAGAHKPHSNEASIGNSMMMAGIVFQVVILTFFSLLSADYLRRVFSSNKRRLSENRIHIVDSRDFRLFLIGICLALVAIYIRSVYRYEASKVEIASTDQWNRIVEMAGGWKNPVMQNEASFIILEGV
ncbi:MAG: hypothetical protein M1820_002080 [Bogoriella megaspora]|nr:MAG: hypothetical protein M1820_002080 [Bogoriella megaspora]